jgi:hypothetical protein
MAMLEMLVSLCSIGAIMVAAFRIKRVLKNVYIR